MAYSKIKLKKGGIAKIVPIGLSWTTFLFNFFPALIRGHLYMGLAMLVCAVVIFGFSSIVFAFFYNKMY